MDGFGLAPASPSNAISLAKTPELDALFAENPHTELGASGEDVGLPDGQIGNSEVGHTNIGAGRIVYQELTRINREIRLGAFFENPVLSRAVSSCKSDGGALHLLGLLSPGGVHSHVSHLEALLELAKSHGLQNVYIHCITDGRDVPPCSASGYISALGDTLARIGTGKIATVMGRFYAMDRDRRWERVERAYNALVLGEGVFNPDALAAVGQSYASGVTDEFIEPVVCDRDGLIKPGDTVIFYNFRPDRARELTRALVDPDFTGFPRKRGFFPLRYVCMTRYDEAMPNVEVAYPPDEVRDTFGEVIASLGLTQFRTAETEKYAHVTFFLNGGTEDVNPGEDRLLVPSPKEFATYDLIPQMSARAVADAAIHRIKSGACDVAVINFANCDMVGHTGVLAAAISAVETVDACVGDVVRAVREAGGVAAITADHGNAEQMLADDGVTPHTAHTTNPVPFILVGVRAKLRPGGRLCDIAPTLLDIMGIEKPTVMTGKSLII
jgi:2,3-bisphosphoglycerate-independent phosphoglycerate mutase